MSSYIPYETPGGVLWVEVETVPDNTQIVNINVFQNTAFKSFQDVVNALTSNTNFIKQALKSEAPSGMEISFGIKAGITPGPAAAKPIFTLSKGTDEANFVIKLKWETKDEI